MYIYILRLKKRKFFIGKTDMVSKIKLKPINKWTRKYKPIDIDEIIDLNSINKLELSQHFHGNLFSDLDFYVLKFMARYGYHNVRGGSFSDLKLKNKTLVSKLILRQSGACVKCEKFCYNSCENRIFINSVPVLS